MENMADTVYSKLLSVPATRTADVTSDALNTEGYQGVLCCVDYGASSDTLSDTVYWQCKITECATEAGTYTDVDNADVLGSSTNAFGLYNASGENAKIFGLSYNGSLQFIKIVCSAEGTHIYGTPLTLFVILKEPRMTGNEQAVNP